MGGDTIESRSREIPESAVMAAEERAANLTVEWLERTKQRGFAGPCQAVGTLDAIVCAVKRGIKKKDAEGVKGHLGLLAALSVIACASMEAGKIDWEPGDEIPAPMPDALPEGASENDAPRRDGGDPPDASGQTPRPA